MRVRHSKLLALVGAGILAITTLVACGNSDTAATAESSARSEERRVGKECRSQKQLQICPAAFPW